MPEGSYSASDITVMILAAGHGKRMLPLTSHTPKPLLRVGEHALIEHHLLRLAKAGFKHIVINVAYLGQQIIQALGNGSQYGLSISYSDESSTGALETAGGIVKALPLIQSDPFLVVNGDIFTDFDFESALQPLDTLGRLVLVSNPQHNSSGDFGVDKDQNKISRAMGGESWTFSGIALYKKSLFESLQPGPQALAPILFEAADRSQLEAVIHAGKWHDVGTPARLEELNAG